MGRQLCLFRSPKINLLGLDDSHCFNFFLSTILDFTKPLGIPWHHLSHEDHDFQPSFLMWASNGTFIHTISLLNEKCLWLLNKLSPLLST